MNFLISYFLYKPLTRKLKTLYEIFLDSPSRSPVFTKITFMFSNKQITLNVWRLCSKVEGVPLTIKIKNRLWNCFRFIMSIRL